MSDTLQSHGLQHTSSSLCLFPRFCSHSHPLSGWCHPTVSSSITCLPLLPSVFPALGSFPMSQLFTSCVRGIEASALPMYIQGWFPLRLTGLIFLQSEGLSRVFSSTTVWKVLKLGTQPSLWSNSHIHTQTGNKLRSFYCFWDCIQVLHFRLLLIMKTTPFFLKESCPQ